MILIRSDLRSSLKLVRKRSYFFILAGRHYRYIFVLHGIVVDFCKMPLLTTYTTFLTTICYI